MILELVGVALVSFAVGFIAARRKYRSRIAATAGLVLPPPLNEEQYEKARGFYIKMYRASMQQYDKLVPWAAGGALVLSTTLLHDVAIQSASVLTRGLLGSSWLFLFVALVSSIVGHFSSSRLYSSARAALDIRQNPKPADAEKLEAAEHDRIANRSKRFTYWSNYVAGGALILGLGLLSAWAFLSLFRQGAPAVSDQENKSHCLETRVVMPPETKALEFIPAVVAVSAPVTVAPVAVAPVAALEAAPVTPPSE